MDIRARRGAENESIFRRINERVEELSRGEATLSLVCECADVACIERIAGVSVLEYEAVRGHGERFFVVRGHERPLLESIVEERGSYLIVDKRGEAGEIAEENDPRSE